jgi:hypothetical protein
METNGTDNNKRQQIRPLSLTQESAVDLLAAGKNDREVGEALGLSRVTVTKWRLYHPEFQAALNARRYEVWGAGVDRLRSLIPQALDALGEALNTPTMALRLKAAETVLELVQLPRPVPSGPTDAEEIIRKQISDRAHVLGLRMARAQYGDEDDDDEDEAERQATEEVLSELAARLAEPADHADGAGGHGDNNQEPC